MTYQKASQMTNDCKNLKKVLTQFLQMKMPMRIIGQNQKEKRVKYIQMKKFIILLKK